jgi:predicted nucleic acid-binding Zn ribbon protein
MKILFLLFSYIANAFLVYPKVIPKISYTVNMSDKNETNNEDCALIPKKHIPKSPLIWQPSTYYFSDRVESNKSS